MGLVVDGGSYKLGMMAIYFPNPSTPPKKQIVMIIDMGAIWVWVKINPPGIGPQVFVHFPFLGFASWPTELSPARGAALPACLAELRGEAAVPEERRPVGVEAPARLRGEPAGCARVVLEGCGRPFCAQCSAKLYIPIAYSCSSQAFHISRNTSMHTTRATMYNYII